MAISRASDSSIQDGFPRFNNIWDGTTATSSFDSLGSVLVPSGGLSSITFSNIPQTYTDLQIRGVARSTDSGTNDVTGRLQFNSDTGSNYSSHRLYGYGSTAGRDSILGTSIALSSVLANGNLAGCFSVVTCDILDYVNTNKFKTTRSLSGGETNTLGMTFLTSGNWRNFNAVTSITLSISSGNWVENSTFSLYGIK